MQSRIFVYTIINVHITFDPAKDEANFAKHGVSLGLAAEIEWDTALTWPDTRKDYDESRMGCIGVSGGANPTKSGDKKRRSAWL